MAVLGWLVPNPAAAEPLQPSLDRDTTYEQNLRWENSADKNVTPAKVMRWITHLRGHSAAIPSPTEFQPIVHVNNSRIHLVAAIAYKF